MDEELKTANPESEELCSFSIVRFIVRGKYRLVADKISENLTGQKRSPLRDSDSCQSSSAAARQFCLNNALCGSVHASRGMK